MALIDGLVSYYKLDTDNATQPDEVSSNDGIVTSATFTSNGLINSAYSFDDSNDVIKAAGVAGGSLFDEEFTISVWAKLSTTASANNDCVVGWGNEGTNNWRGQIQHNKTSNSWQASSKGVTGENTVSDSGEDTNWHHLVIVVDSDSHINNFWVDGVDAGSDSTHTQTISADTFYIGQLPWSSANVNPFPGEIDEISVWNRQITSAEVAELYNGGEGLQHPFDVTALLNTNLVSYYKLDVDSSTQIDSVGSNNGTVTSATFTSSGKINAAYDFEAGDASNKITLSDNVFNAHTLGSISIWVKPETNPAAADALGIGADGNNYFLFGTQNGKVVGFFKSGGTNQWKFESTATLSLGVWSHILITQDGTAPVIYINGSVAAGSFTISTNKTKWFNDLVGTIHYEIGKNGYTTANWWDGVIDELAIWDKELSPVEITTLYNYGSGLQYPFDANPLLGGLEAYYKFDVNSSSQVDSTSNGNDLTVTGATFTSSGQINGAYAYTTNDFIEADSNTSLDVTTGDFSLNIWINLDASLGAGNYEIIDKRKTVSPFNGYTLYYQDPNKLRFQISDGTLTDETHTVTLEGQGWTMITISVERGVQVEFYIDGVSVKTSTGYNARTGSLTNTSKLLTGKDTFNGAFFEGDLDEFGFWSRALSDDEVTELYNSGAGFQYPFGVGVTVTTNAIFMSNNF